ncbi:MAG: response regulator [Ignavibacteriales bacterium]|nr:response regulator [Ignavibacteriales bacterium]
MDQAPESSREIFRQCLRQADRFIIEGKFSEAKQQLAEAKKIDSRNPFIIAFEERIALFENKINTIHKQPTATQKEPEPQTQPETITPSSSTTETLSREIIELQLRQSIETEFKTRYTEELRKAEEQAARLLEEERIALQQQQHLLHARYEEQISTARKQLDDEFQKHLASEISALEEKLSQQHKQELSALEKEIKDKLTLQHQNEIDNIKKDLESNRGELESGKQKSFTERENELKKEFDIQLQTALRKTKETISADYSKQLESERKKITSDLSAEYNDKLNVLQQTIDRITKELEQDKSAFLKREAELKQEYELKIDESVKNTLLNFDTETTKSLEQEQMQIEQRLKDEYEKRLAIERKILDENITLLENERRSFSEREQTIKKQYESNLAEALKEAEASNLQKTDKQVEKEIKRLKNELEHELKLKLDEEKKAFKQLEKAIENERAEFQNHQKKLKEQHENDLKNALAESERSHKQEITLRLDEERKKITKDFTQQLAAKLEEEKEAFRILEAQLVQERKEFTAREQELKKQQNQKLLDALRKTEIMFQQQSAQQLEMEREKITAELRSVYDKKLEEDRLKLSSEFDVLRIEFESSYQKRINELELEAQNRLREQLATLQKNQEEDLAKHRITLRKELELEIEREYEIRLLDEKQRIQKESDTAIEEEKKRLDEQYNKMIETQNEQVQKLRSDLRNEMEQVLLSRLERIATEYDHKMELLGARIPETKEERYEMYRMKMLDCYITGQPSVAEARVLMQLKELLELTFDEHLAIEADVRLDLYVKRVEKMILTGEMNLNNTTGLEKLKQQFSITPEEATRLEQFILASFQRLTKKGRILIVDDDELLLHSLEDLLNDCDYQVVTSPDIETALEKLNNTTFDLILSDIKFGVSDLDGFKFFKAVQEKPHLRSIPFVFMSALIDGVIIRSGIQLGVDDYITKPMDPDLLIATIEGKLKRFREIKLN